MKIRNETALPTPVVRRVLHWWSSSFGTTLPKSEYPKGVRVRSIRTQSSSWEKSQGELVIGLGTRDRGWPILDQLVHLGLSCVRSGVLWAKPDKRDSITQNWASHGSSLVQDWLKEYE